MIQNYPDISWDIGDAQSGTKQEEFIKTINELYWLYGVGDVTRVWVNNKPSMFFFCFFIMCRGIFRTQENATTKQL